MFRLSVPSKTFLIGEYVALEGGPALLLNTTPRFGLEVQKDNKVFRDPHRSRGGFGASGAEALLLAYADALNEDRSRDAFGLLETVEKQKKQMGWSLGSGYDVLSMMAGKVAFVERKSHQLESFDWPFANLDWILLRGKNKIATHTHLESLKRNNFSGVSEISKNVVESFKNRVELEFIEGVQNFARELCQLGLVEADVENNLAEIRKIEGVRAAKGCGALGADTQLVLVASEKRGAVLNALKKFEIIDCILSEGLKVEAL